MFCYVHISGILLPRKCILDYCCHYHRRHSMQILLRQLELIVTFLVVELMCL